MAKKTYKSYRESSENWFYRKFIKNTVNDNFITPFEALNKTENRKLIDRIKQEIKIKVDQR